MNLTKRTIGIVAVLLIVGGSYLHTHYMLVGSSGGIKSVTFKHRGDVAAELRVTFATAEKSAASSLRIELNSLRDDLLKRFDEKFTPDHTSPLKAVVRDAKYYWDLARTFSSEKGLEAYNEDVKNRIETHVITQAALAERIGEIIFRTNENLFITANIHANFNASVTPNTLNFQSATTGLPSELSPADAPLRPSSAHTARAVTRHVLSNLTKYYVSASDAASLSKGLGPSASAVCNVQINICKQLLSQSYTLTREGLKKIGVGIGTTAARAAGLANAVGFAVLTYQAYGMYDNYSSSLGKRNDEIKEKFARYFETLINSYSAFDGEYRQQLRWIADKLIEDQTKPWSFSI